MNKYTDEQLASIAEDLQEERWAVIHDVHEAVLGRGLTMPQADKLAAQAKAHGRKQVRIVPDTYNYA